MNARQDDQMQETPIHDVVIESDHYELFECKITCNRSDGDEITDVTAYRVVIKNQLGDCLSGDGGAVIYKLNKGDPLTIKPDGFVTIDKTTATDDTLEIWYQECGMKGTSQSREVPKAPRVTLTLTKKGDEG